MSLLLAEFFTTSVSSLPLNLSNLSQIFFLLLRYTLVATALIMLEQTGKAWT